ncbi:tetratricopeptide repeat protein [Blastomonas sp.]|uniref:tetratricopeptide repeat protein n=1 Tax=Blastomonas sp. TaxID=1909299 RepID=UPI003593FE05
MRFLPVFAAIFIACLVMGAAKVPLARDGLRNSAVFNGQQNMPVTLYGIARDWSNACIGGKPASCIQLAEAFETGLGDITPNMRIAVGYYLEGCKKGSGLACAEAATIIREGTAAYINLPLAHETARRGCEELRNHDACSVQALALYRGAGVAQDKPRALSLWDAACNAKADLGCRLKAGSLFNESSDTADHTAALKLFTTACAAKAAWGCAGLAYAHHMGRGTAADATKAASFARTSCEDGSGDKTLGCALHARYLVYSGDPKLAEKGSFMLTSTCMAGVAEACNDAGEAGKRQLPGSKLAQWEVPVSFRQGCDAGLAVACRNLGILYADGFRSVKRNLPIAVALLDKACTARDAMACDRVTALGTAVDSARSQRPLIDPTLPSKQQLARASEEAKTGNRKAALFTVARLMEEAVADAEWMMGGWMYYGQPGIFDTPDRKNGFILLENAARQGHVEAAKWVGYAYWTGEGVPVDRAKGEGYTLYAANRGDAQSIGMYRVMRGTVAREANEARNAEMAAAAQRNANSWSTIFARAAAQWVQQASARPYATGPDTSASWQNHLARADRTNFNNRMNYLSGRSSVCPSFNPYC